MEKGKELEFHEGPGGGKGSRIREADSDDRGFPLIHSITIHSITIHSMNINSRKGGVRGTLAKQKVP
jgi:hypothetical protein